MIKEKKQIVITGYGVISAAGMNKEENRKNIFAGKSGITDAEFYYKDGTKVSASGVITEKLKEHSFYKEHNIIPDRASHLALLAADDCLADAKLDTSAENPLKVGIIIGTSLGGMRSADIFHTKWLEEGIDAADPKLLTQYPLHAVADILAMQYGFNGAKITISTACSSGANAIGLGTDLINGGLCDVVLAGGVDPISRFSFAGFTSLKAIDTNQCRPYSASTGINLGEGAAFFLLESNEHAEKRGADIKAEIKGYGISADAYHPTAPDIAGNGAVRSMTAAMVNGVCNMDDLSYINGHGTGTPSNDNSERKSWKAFVKENTDIPLISNKAAVGHCMGAAGAVEIALSVLSIENNQVPPTVNYNEEEAKPDGGINFVPNKAMDKEVNNVLSNSFAFGGNNCSVLISKYKKREMEQMEYPDIVITGIGCVGTGGANTEELFETFKKGESWIEEIDTSEKDFTVKYKGKMPELDFKKYIPGRVLRRVDQVTKLAMTSGRQALLNSGLKVTPKNAGRIGVIYGTGTGPLETIEKVSRNMILTGYEGVDANIFPNTVLNAAPGNFSIANMLKGPTSTISAGSVSGLDAFIYAAELLKNNQADAIVVLSADEWNDALQTGNEKLGLLSKSGKLPFSKEADGMILAPGSAAFVLERKDHAEQRGADILAKVSGYAITSDNSPLCSFSEDGTQWKDSFLLAKEAAENPEIDYYASTSYGIPVLDKKELELMTSVLDDNTQIRSIPRLLGASSGTLGGYGLLSCVYALINQTVPEQGELSDEVDETFVKLERRTGNKPIETAAVSAASFGGSYTSVIISKVK